MPSFLFLIIHMTNVMPTTQVTASAWGLLVGFHQDNP